jgi:hypothetical protein
LQVLLFWHPTPSYELVCLSEEVKSSIEC